ncbi:thioredoxin family protein [Allomuricauda sp. SCSIO 65647]|uniref:thioredoxin family protein n=1 Tax=Allomuricauda sp. SCSIO 65647 TaxID=2908843 RepID=UPI001F307D28|nr:thioredoxin family protein [Muricauda sp. SCSIO 65647]UJH66468.1 thioredoxin family protein [Muricauda sp. SCSIO 65647]
MRTIFIVFFSTFVMHAQEFNREIILDNGKQFLVGKITLQRLNTEPYKAWYNTAHESYAVDQAMVQLFKNKLSDYKILLFLGTWCGDSKREVPRFIKILEAADYSLENLSIVALDRRKEFYKKSPTGEEKGLNIIKVPTFIFYKDGIEINRIVESPIESLEEDITAIVGNKTYTPNYTQGRK